MMEMRPIEKPEGERPKRGAMYILRKAAPWVVLGLVSWLIFRKVPVDKVVGEFRALGLTQIVELTVVSVLFIVGVCVIDAFALRFGFGAFKVKVAWRELFLVRSAMMLLVAIASPIGQAGLAAHLVRKHKLGAGVAAGMVTFLLMLEVYGMLAVATIAFPLLMFIKGGELADKAPVLKSVLMVAGLWPTLIVVILAARSEALAKLLDKFQARLDSPPELLRWLPFRLVSKLLGIKISGIAWKAGAWILNKFQLALEPLRLLSSRQVFSLLGLKTILGAWQIGLTLPAFWIYGLDMPALDLFAFMPLAIMVSSIPVTPGKLGITQYVWVTFFAYLYDAQMGPEHAKAALVAFSLLLQVTLNVVRWIIGAAALPFISRHFQEGG
jgi:hypothetical protein